MNHAAPCSMPDLNRNNAVAKQWTLATLVVGDGTHTLCNRCFLWMACLHQFDHYHLLYANTRYSACFVTTEEGHHTTVYDCIVQKHVFFISTLSKQLWLLLLLVLCKQRQYLSSIVCFVVEQRSEKILSLGFHGFMAWWETLFASVEYSSSVTSDGGLMTRYRHT